MILASAAAAALIAVVIALGVWGRGESARLSYELTGDARPVTDTLLESGTGGDVLFSDGTRVSLEVGSKVRIVELDTHGASLLLEGGKISLNVVPKARARWAVAAGPFRIAVTGTEFTAEWSEGQEQLEVRLSKGSVVVSGPLMPGGTRLLPGQRLRASLKEHRLSVDRDATEAPAQVAGDPTPTSEEVSAPPVNANSRSLLQPTNTPVSWSKRVASGDFEGVLVAANTLGLEGCLKSCTLPDLSALADAARYRSQTGLARDCLLAIRARFSGNREGKAASFLLGRMAEGRGAASHAEALRWFDLYLQEQPNGPLAAEALAHKMLLIQGAQGASAARPLAVDYLARFPGGSYEHLAREIAESR